MQLQRDRIPDGRHVHAQDLHCTLRFLGQLPLEQLVAIEAVAGELSFPRFELQLDHLGWWKRPKILYVAPSITPPALLQAAGELDRLLQAHCGIEPEERPYRPHVTLARKIPQPALRAWNSAIRWPIEGFALVRSTTGSELPRYRVMKKWLADS